MPQISKSDVEKAFQILSMEPTVQRATIRKRAIELLLVNHPDKSKSATAHSITLAINGARDTLNDLSDEELQSFVDAILKSKASIPRPQSNTNERMLSNTISLPIFVGINPRMLINKKSPHDNNFFASDFIESCLLLVGSQLSGKNEFYQHAFHDSGLDFRNKNNGLINHSVYNLATIERFKSITTLMYKRASVVFFFDNDLGHFYQWIRTMQESKDSILLTLTLNNNLVDLQPYDWSSDTFKLCDLNVNTNLEELVLRTSSNHSNRVSLNRIKGITDDIFHHIDASLLKNSLHLFEKNSKALTV
jgi:hypothetical protein